MIQLASYEPQKPYLSLPLPGDTWSPWSVEAKDEGWRTFRLTTPKAQTRREALHNRYKRCQAFRSHRLATSSSAQDGGARDEQSTDCQRDQGEGPAKVGWWKRRPQKDAEYGDRIANLVLSLFAYAWSFVYSHRMKFRTRCGSFDDIHMHW